MRKEFSTKTCEVDDCSRPQRCESNRPAKDIRMIRANISRSKRVRIFHAAAGKCHICQMPIEAGEAWDVEHRIPLAMGGSDDESELRPAHRKCHRDKTSKDVAHIAQAKRREARHIGAHKSRNPLPGGRLSKWRKKLTGEVVPR